MADPYPYIGRSTQHGFIQDGKAWQFFRNPQAAYSAGYIKNRPDLRTQFANGGGAWLSTNVTVREKIQVASASPARKVSTYALGTGQSVAGLGETIPILFGKRTTTSGGMVIAPNAVYQRMHSEGVYEWLRAAYVIGEGGVTLGLPALRGIRLGSKSIDANSISYWSFGATTGSTADNDPTTSNTPSYGSFKLFEELSPNNEYLTGTINQGEVRSFSQVIDSNESFGFSGEEPDCDGESGAVASSTITPVSLNPVQAFITNTRSCEVTEIGLAAALASNSSNKNEVAPPGSLWVSTLPGYIGDVYRVVSIATALSSFYPYVFRKDVNNRSTLDAALATRQADWNSGARYVIALDPDTLVPLSAGLGGVPRKFSNFVSNVGTLYQPYTGENRNRNTTPATGYALPAPNPCTPPSFTSILSDPNNPKMAFHIYWRSATNASSDAWRQLTTQPLIIACADSTVMFSTLKIQHPSLSAVQYKFEPILPDTFAEQYMNFNAVLFEGNVSHQAASKGNFPIIYSRNAAVVNINVKDGFKLSFKGGFAPFYGDVTLDDQSVNYAVSISYVNEIIQDSPNYPHMSTAVLNVRGFKGMTSMGQLSLYYDDGAEIPLLETGGNGTSNMFPELANYLLTTFPGGTGAVSASSIDTASFLKAINFTRAKGLFFDGVITDKSGVFEFIAEHAEYFLLRFGMNQGKYAFTIAIQDSSTGTSSAAATQVLTMDDIIADSYSVEYKTLQDREEAFVNVVYRVQEQYMLGEDRTVTVAPSGYTGSNILYYDISDFCTTENHAVTFARFALATRIKQTHTVRFTTFLGRIDLSPGRLFSFNLSATTSLGKTYTNTEQYQVVSAVYQANGLVDVQAVHMPTDLSSVVFSNTYKVVT
jgi:hypothetical protein